MSGAKSKTGLLTVLVAAALSAAIVMSGIWVVAAQHEARQLFAELEALNREQDRLQIDWGRLQLEQSSHASHSLIESIARERLDFAAPNPELLVVLEEPAQ